MNQRQQLRQHLHLRVKVRGTGGTDGGDFCVVMLTLTSASRSDPMVMASPEHLHMEVGGAWGGVCVGGVGVCACECVVLRMLPNGLDAIIDYPNHVAVVRVCVVGHACVRAWWCACLTT